MDVKVSRKEKRWQPDGTGVEVLVDNIFDLYPVYGNALNRDLITDVEVIDDEEEELLDRAMFAVVKQRGADPCDPSDGNRWAEAMIGEVASVGVLDDVYKSVAAEGPGVRLAVNTVNNGGKPGTAFAVELVKTA